MFNHNTRRKIAKAVAFNPAWLDENGFMTNVPFSNGYVSDIPEPYTQRVGSYVHSEPLRDARYQLTGVVHEEMLRFTIGKDFILQELPRQRRAIINRNHHLIVVKDSTDRTIEHWETFLDSPTLTPGELVSMKWLRTMVVGASHSKHTAKYVPATLERLYTEVSHVAGQAMRKLGYGDVLDAEPEDEDATTPFPWLYVPAQRATDATDYNASSASIVQRRGRLPKAAWLAVIPSTRQCELWVQLNHVAKEIRDASANERHYAQTRDEWVERLKDALDALVSELDDQLNVNPKLRDMN